MYDNDECDINVGDLVKITSKGHEYYNKVCLVVERDNTLYRVLFDGLVRWFHYKEIKRLDT